MEWLLIYVFFSFLLSIVLWVMDSGYCICSRHWHNTKLNLFRKILFTLLAIVIIPLDFLAGILEELIGLR